MTVRDAMSRDLVTVSIEDTVEEAAKRMLNRTVGSVLVTSGDNPTGILTETDIIAAGVQFGRPFDDIPVSRAMSGDLVTISPDASLLQAIKTMQDNDVKKLPVVEEMEVVGIVTMTDVVRHQSDLLTAVRQFEDRRRSERVDTDPGE